MSYELPEHVKQMFADKAKELKMTQEVSIEPIYKRCAQMARVKELGGPVGYGLRSCAASIIKLSKEQDYSILWANDPNPELVEGQTHNMIVNSVTDNPSTCERFNEYNPGGCVLCQYRGKIKSPVSIGFVNANQAEVPKIVIQVKQNDPPNPERLSQNQIDRAITDLSSKVYSNLDSIVVVDGKDVTYTIQVPTKKCLMRFERNSGRLYIDLDTYCTWFGVADSADGSVCAESVRPFVECGAFVGLWNRSLMQDTFYPAPETQVIVFDVTKLKLQMAEFP